ncbi:MAG TPA: UvrD-helicase domain-containing protein [Dehalococcoidia bacterium]
MTFDPVAADDLARRQIRELLDETLFVEASAGTGKTAALVDRYIALVLAGRTVDRIVAITFTDKAAAELRDRVRQELEARLEKEADAGRRALIDAALAGLDRAQISTIHAFCQALLRFFAVRAGIDPAFEVQDEVASQRRFEERWRTYLDSLGDRPDAVDKVGRLLDLGMLPRYLQELAEALWQRGELAERLHGSPLSAPPAAWPDLHTLRARLAAVPIATVPADDKLRQRIEGLLVSLDDLIDAGDERDAHLVSAAAGLNPRLGNTGRADNWKGSLPVNDARNAAIAVTETLLATLSALRSQALADVLPFVVEFVMTEAVERGRDGALMFDDLILKTRNVLRDYESARHAVRERYDTLLIDEFQDTDPLQAEIARYFATDPMAGRPESGRLFLVGDPKQSIYRFRRADMAMYAKTAAELQQAGARHVDLSLNRRSQPGVIDWVNGVFERLMHGVYDLEIQPAYQPLAPQRPGGLDGPAVSWFGEAMDVSAPLLRQLEAGRIAAYCREVVRQGWQVYDRTLDAARPARYRDVAVLLPARTILQPLERALAAEAIPYRVEGGSLVYATQELRDLINCLTAIDDPSDDVAVVAALRSPAYACSDVDLAAYRLHQAGSFNYLRPDLDAFTGPVAAGLRDLRDWHLRRGNLTLAALTEGFISHSRLVEIGLLDAGNRNAFRRARFLVEQARAFEAAGPESLRAFVEWLEGNVSEAILDQEGAGLDDDEDAVRILTIHAAKGLEFPIVFLAGLGAPPRNQPPVFGHDRSDGRIAVQAGRVATRFNLGPVDEVMKHEQEHDLAERDRLLYVGATRARDHLIVSLFHKQNSSNTAAARLLQHGARDLAQTLPAVSIASPAAAAPFAGLTVDVADEDGFDEARARLVASSRTLRFTSATALGREAAPEEDKGEREDEGEPWSRGRAGTHLGRAVHAALQSLAWDADDAAIDAVARAQAVAEAIPTRADEAAALVRVALASQAAQRARTARRALREVPFAFKQDGVIVEGFADLVIEHEDGIEIVDWKTDRVPGDAVSARLENYKTQAGLYVLGLQNATGRPVTRVTYVFVSPNREASIGEPPALAAAALQRLRDEAVTSA